MKFLFTSDGFPGIEGVGTGSGIGTHLAEITSGFVAQGHECHVLSWGPEDVFGQHAVAGAHVHLLPRGYWPVVERFAPGSQQAYARRDAAHRLDRLHHFDWIEIENDEGIDIGVQRIFRERSMLRVHTTLAQMVEYKKIVPNRATRAYLDRERRSIRQAKHVIVSTTGHAAELTRLFSLESQPHILRQGFNPPSGVPPVSPENTIENGPSFLVVGSLDRRKGTDRLRSVLEAYSRRFGPCRCVLVTTGHEESRADFGLETSPEGVKLDWRSGLTAAELFAEYARSSALLHLARYESFGYPAVEAASMGTPVVATATGTAPDLLSGDLARFLIHGDHPDEVAKALFDAISRPSLGQELRYIYSKLYSREAMVGNYLEAIERWTNQRDRTCNKNNSSI